MAYIIINYIFIAVQILIGYNLIVPLVLYVLYFLKRKEKFKECVKDENDYAIIVTAYQQTDSLPPVIDSILKLNYNNYKIYVVGDKCDLTQLKLLEKLDKGAEKKLVLLRPEETLASNTRSHFYAINRFVRNHTHLIIIDSDNLIEPNCLNELNRCFASGYLAVQGQRKAKNLDTTYACLDAARDIYYHFFDGLVLFNVGSSATLCGSGMAFTVDLYKECLGHLDVTGAGFDKVLQKEIVSRGHRIAFNDDAVVYDEKTSKSDQLVKQRARWINTWFKYFKYGFTLVAQGIVGFNWNKLLFGIILLRPPLFIFLLLSGSFMVANIWLNTTSLIAWAIGFACFILGFIIALAHGKPDKKIVRSLISIPKFIFFQVLSLLQAKKANKISVATTHYATKGLDEIERQK